MSAIVDPVVVPEVPVSIAPDPFVASPSAPDPDDLTVVPAEESPVDKITAEFDDVEKLIEPRVWMVEGDLLVLTRTGEVMQHFAKEYIQEPLSYRGMVEFTGLIGRKVDESMSGEDGISIASIIELAAVAGTAAGEGGTQAVLGTLLGGEDTTIIDTFVKGFAKLTSYIPDILDEAQCIWLRVPIRERLYVREIWSQAPSKGGLSGDEGEEMMRVFIDQNYEELERFFVERLRRTGKTLAKARKRMHLVT